MWSHLGAGDCTDIYFCQAARHRVLATPGFTEDVGLRDCLGQRGGGRSGNHVNPCRCFVTIACICRSFSAGFRNGVNGNLPNTAADCQLTLCQEISNLQWHESVSNDVR